MESAFIKNEMVSCMNNSLQVVEIDNKLLSSVFQPIYSFSNQACIGFEVLVRGKSADTGFKVPVSDCLTVPQSMSEADYRKQLNRLHLQNWQTLRPENNWLFLNLDFQGVTELSDICLLDLFNEFQFQGHEVVIEVVESEIADEALFEDIIFALRAMGCLIALDDFGAGHSNIDRIWKAQPDIVKLDRGVLLEATRSARGQSVLRNLTKLIKEAGSICLLEGIETQEQALLAMEAGVDLVQGFYFARPDKVIDSMRKGEVVVQSVIDDYPAYVKRRQQQKSQQIKGYEVLFETMSSLSSQEALEQAMQRLGYLSFVKRFFIINESGYQVNDEQKKIEVLNRLEVLQKSKGLCWKNRRYFIEAMQNPEAVFVSNPYRSLIDMQLCLTVSKVILIGEQRFVACFDLHYLEQTPTVITAANLD